MSESIPLGLDPKVWDSEMVESARAVYDGIQAAMKIHVDIAPQLPLPLREEQYWGQVMDIYDRLQDQLRVPVIITPPDEEEALSPEPYPST